MTLRLEARRSHTGHVMRRLSSCAVPLLLPVEVARLQATGVAVPARRAARRAPPTAAGPLSITTDSPPTSSSTAPRLCLDQGRLAFLLATPLSPPSTGTLSQVAFLRLCRLRRGCLFEVPRLSRHLCPWMPASQPQLADRACPSGVSLLRFRSLRLRPWWAPSPPSLRLVLLRRPPGCRVRISSWRPPRRIGAPLLPPALLPSR